MTKIIVSALYKFVDLPDFEAIQEPLHKLMQQQKVRGTILLAREGINGTIAGSEPAILGVLNWLKQDERLSTLEHKESLTDELPFRRAKVKLKQEIVTMGIPGVNPGGNEGTYIEPEDWNDLIADPEVMLIDTRNEYEVRVGKFTGALNPDIETFRDFPAYVRANLDPKKHKKVAMYCTGGIRCEKSTAWLKSEGFEEVYQLHGGILKYLEDVPQEQSQWKGDCFVFDDRVTVNHQLRPGDYIQCNACRMPLSAVEQKSPDFVQGVSCSYCHDKTSEQKKAACEERERQMQLASAQGASHLGQDAIQTQQLRASAKRQRKEQQRRQS